MAKGRAYTRKKHEEYLNALYKDCYTSEQALDHFGHMGRDITVLNYYAADALGTLQRKKDPIGFEVSYNEIKRSKK